MTMRLPLLWLLPSMVVVACGGEPSSRGPVERVVASPLKFQVEAEGQIQSAHATPLPVPGQQWTRRQPIWLLSDGAHVETGDLIARFSPEQSELELAQFLIDIQRNQLSRVGKEAELGGAQSRVDIDLVDVATRMGIAHRYADADLAEYFSRNEVLDAIDDLHFLDTRQHILDWKRGQFARRGAAEIAVLDAQRASHQRNAQQRRADLSALELRAPHAGVLMLAADWAGEKPRVGVPMMAGQPLGYLPDFTALEIELKVPQMEAQALSVGQKVRVHLLGRPDHSIETRLASVAITAEPRNRENPAPYLTARAPLPAEAVRSFGLTPGMRMSGQIDLLETDRGISVANIAVLGESGRSAVYVRTRHGDELRQIGLGAHGIIRSQVLKGLSEGDEVLLTPPHAPAAPGAPGTEHH